MRFTKFILLKLMEYYVDPNTNFVLLMTLFCEINCSKFTYGIGDNFEA